MKYLYRASQTEERFALLLSLTKICSEDVIEALRDHLVKGATGEYSATVNGVTTSNFQRAFNKLDKVAATVERIKEIDIYKSHKR